MSQVKLSQRRRPAVRSSVRRQHHFASVPAQSCTTTGTPEIQPVGLDLCATVAGPTNGRQDRAAGEDGFVLVFLFIEGFGFDVGIFTLPQGRPTGGQSPSHADVASASSAVRSGRQET